MLGKTSYPKRLAIIVSQFINTVLGGWEDETFSARSFRNRYKSTAWHRTWRTIDFVFGLLGDRSHCYESWRAGRIRSAAYLRGSKEIVPFDAYLD